MLNCIDNSGAAIVECVNVMKMKRHAKIGTLIGYKYTRELC
jgi:ribosomal protein L14